MADHRLIVRTGPNPGTVFDLSKEVTMFGRDVTNDIPLSDAEISRQHSRLTRTPGGMVLEDLGSTNGTFVNGDRLTSPRVLRSGDLVGLGENVTLTFEATSPLSVATVMSPARGGPPLRPAPRPAALPPVSAGPATPMGMPAASAEEGRGGRRRWLLAGCGCLLILAACIAGFALMDAYAPDTLYAPLRMLGF
jgi:hypothetical protein